MIWTSWRRQRAQLITLLGMLVVGAGVIILLRSNMIDALTSSQLTRCVTQAIDECAAPAEAQKTFRTEWATPLQTAQLLIIGLPALIGVFIGAPLFARELEQGTHVLAFTQSVSRTRWMLSKMVVALVPALIVLVALQYLVWWWLTAAGTLGPRLNGSFNAVNFGIEHVSPAGYALFASALGTFVGVVSRRTLAAMTALRPVRAGEPLGTRPAPGGRGRGEHGRVPERQPGARRGLARHRRTTGRRRQGPSADPGLQVDAGGDAEHAGGVAGVLAEVRSRQVVRVVRPGEPGLAGAPGRRSDLRRTRGAAAGRYRLGAAASELSMVEGLSCESTLC
jgi:hypothetical protein